jgi:hypothetical protein
MVRSSTREFEVWKGIEMRRGDTTACNIGNSCSGTELDFKYLLSVLSTSGVTRLCCSTLPLSWR